MDIRSLLKEKTQSQHTHVENTPLLKKITEKNITLAEYIQLLKKLYGYIYQCERTILSIKFCNLIHGREKTDLLIKDLTDLQSMDQSIQIAQQNSDTPILSQKLDILGYLYVIEGSTLGGQVISKILSNLLDLSPKHGLHYFYGYGSHTKKKWDEICIQLNTISSEPEMNAVITSANNTFETLSAWLIKN